MSDQTEQGTEDSDYREQIARALVPGGDQSTFGRVLDVVAPLVEQLRQARAEAEQWRATFGETALADHVAEVDQLRAASSKFDERISDLQAEYAKHYAAWEKQHARLTGERRLLLWLHAEAVWLWLHAEAVWLWQRAEADETRAHRALAAVGRAIECFLGVEYGTPVGSARVLVERCADAESALDGLRATAVVLPEDWCDQLDWAYSGEHRLDLIESWRAAPVLPVTPDEHVREHDDAAPTRDKVAEAWADTWDGVDRSELPDHPHVDPGDGRTECPSCGKYVWPVIHSCKGVRVVPPTLAQTRTGIDSDSKEESGNG